MKPEHVLDFCNNRIEFYEKLQDDNKAEYLKALTDYNALPFYKRWFTWHPYESEWDHCFTPAYIRQLKAIRNKAIYNAKMNYSLMEIDSMWKDAFYRWAKENNIPY